MTAHESFITFANRVMQGNNLLIGTPSRLDTTALRAKLELNMSTFLSDKITRLRATDKERITSITVFEDWLAEISLLDEEITADLKRIADFATEHLAKRQRIDTSDNVGQSNPYPQRQHPRATPAFLPPLTGANAITPNMQPYPPQYIQQSTTDTRQLRGAYRGSNTQRPNKRLRCPKLLPIEYELLEKHNSCRKCRKFYVSHRVLDCPNDFPNPETHATLTEDMALQAMALAAIASTYNAHTHSTTTSTFVPTSLPNFTSSPSAFIEIAPTEPSTNHHSQSSVAAILPSTSIPFNLGNGSDTESEPSNVSPISIPHYIWHANIHSNDEFPTPIQCLLDNGISTQSYSCPCQYKEAFTTLIQQHLDSGFIRPSSSSFASPSFIVPKKDPKAIPRWVCDYQKLNANTIR